MCFHFYSHPNLSLTSSSMPSAYPSPEMDERTTNTTQDYRSRHASSSITYSNTDPNSSITWDHTTVVTTFDVRASDTPTSMSFPHWTPADNIQSATQLSFGMGSLSTYDHQAGSGYTNSAHNSFQPSPQAISSTTYDEPVIVNDHQDAPAYNAIESAYHTTDNNSITDTPFHPQQQLSLAVETSPIYTTPPINTPLAPGSTTCPDPKCAAKFSRPIDLTRHYQSIHLRVRCHCKVPTCHNNNG